MKKQLIWALTLVLLALFPYQNAKADLIQLNRAGWTATACSEHANNSTEGDADYALDGSLGTWWHTEYDNNADVQTPHWILFNLGEVTTFDAFNYVSRTADPQQCNGNIQNYTLYVSSTAPNTSNISGTMTEVITGTFNYNAQEHKVTLNQSVSGQYVLLYASTTLGSAGANKHANCAEFYLYKKGYCVPSGNMANSGNGAGRKLNSFTLSDGASQLEVPNIQTSATDAVYKDKTDLVLTTNPGATLSFSALDWTGSWMHAYVYIDYDSNETFSNTANNNGTTGGELVSYNYYNDKNINNATMANGCGVSASNIPSWTLPSNLTPGEYRLRFKIDWNSIDACGSSSIAADNGCVVDITLRVEEPITSRTITVVASPTEGGVVKANGTEGGVTAEGVVTITAEANTGYSFLKWINTATQEQVTTNAEFTNNEAGDISYTAVFAQLKQFTFNVTQPTGGTISVVNGEGQSVETAYENENITVSISVNGAYTLEGLYINDNLQALDTNNSISFTLTDAINSEINIRAELTKIPVEQLYAAMSKPIFTEAGNLKAVDTYAEILEGSIGATAGAVDMSTLTTVKIGDHTWKQGATAPIYLSPGAQFSLKTKVHATTFYGMQLYLLHNTADTILESYGYYGTSSGWDTDEFWAEVNADTKISADQSASTITFPITLPESVKVGDIVVLRAISTATVTSPTVSAGEGAYVDYLFYVVEPVAPSVAVKASPAEGGSVTINGGTDPIEIGEGVDVTVTAKPNPGYEFTGWTVRGEQISTDLTYTERVTTQKVFVANFVKPYTITASEAIKLYYQQYVGRGYQNQTLSRVKVTTTAQNNARFGNAIVSLAGTTDLSDISKVKVYLTNDTVFNAPSNPVYDSSKQEALLLGETSDITSEEVTFVIGENAMYNGVNYLWVVCDVASNASEDNVIKAQLKSIDGTDIAQLASDNGRMIMLGFNVLYDLNYDGSKYYRIPAIITAADGSLVALTDKRGATLTDLPNVISIVSRRSTDGGKTWSTPVYVAKGGETSQGSGRVDAYGDVAVMLDKESGNLISVFVGYQNRSNSSEGGSDGRVGLAASNQNNLLRLYKSVSTDNGQSWGTPVDISETVYSQIYTSANGKLGTTRYGLFAGSGHALTMEDGRLMFVVAARSTSNILPLHNFSVYSDDHGQTWTVSTNAATPDSNNSGNEAKVVELGNGNVLMSIRNGGARKFALSTDRGQSWNAATTSTLADPGCNGDIISYKYKGKTYLIQSICGSSSTRENVTIYLSTDNGATWPVRRQLVSGRSEYSSLTVLNDGSIAAFVEVGKHVDANDIGMRQTFFNFSLDWLLQGYDLDNTVLEFDGTRYMTIPDHDDFDIASNESFTVSAKFRYNALTENSNQRIIAKRNYGVLTQPGYELWGGNSTTQILAVNSPNASNNHNNSLSVWSTKTGVAGEWYHVALVIDRTNNVMTLYHNGEAVGSSSGKDLSQWSCVTDYDVYVGALLNGSNVDYKMNGAVDDLRFYGRALSASDVATDMNSSMPLENALAAYDFEMMSGYSVPDITGNGHTGTLVGFPEQILERTVSVMVTPSDAAESVTINGLERTSLTASGDITINVEPKDGYRFVKWTDGLGNDVSTNKEYVDNSTQDTTYVANLVKLWKVTVTTNNRAWGIADISGVDANGFVDNAADVTLTATSNNDARFMYWGLRTTENEKEVIKPVTTTNPFKTTILRNEDYVAVFEGDYPTMRLKYENGSGTDDERRVNRYLASVTATAGNLTTVVFEATNESGLPRIDAEVSAFYKHNEENLIPTTSGALIDKTGNAIMVKKRTETITLNFKSWHTNISLRSNTAEPELDQTQQAIFVDWNNNKNFLDDGENLGIVSSTAENSFKAADGYNREISIPASAECGTYRMRVIYYDNLGSSDDWTSTIFEDCVINQGRAYDFEIDIVDDANYITFDAPGETYFSVGDKANIQMTYPNNDEAVIYYTTDGFDPDENSPSITNGGAVAINTLQEGMITLKAIAMVDGVKSQVYKAVYTVVSKSSNLGAPTIKSAADATTIIAAEISQGKGIANGPIDYKFTQGQQVKLNAIPTTATATFSLDVTLDLNKYGLLIYRLDALKEFTQKSIQLTASYTADEIVSVNSFKNTLESKGFLYDIIDEAEGKIKIKIPIAMAMDENYYLSNGESVIYRLIVTNKETGNNVTLLPDQDYGIGEYVDFVFTVSPQTTKTKVAGGAGKQLSFTITTDDACYLSVGGYAQNLDEAGTTTIEAPLNVVGEMEIQSVGANISKMDVEILEYGTNVVLPNVDYLGTVTVKSDAELNATTISYASQLPADGIHIVVEKEIKVPHVNDNDPTYFNFLSMPFEFDCGLNIEYWDGDSWETAVLEKDIRILKYKARTRAQGKDYYDYTWSTIGGPGGMIYANEGFVLVGNSDYGDADHKMKIRFKSFNPTDNTNVKRELKYFQDGGIKTVGVLPYRNTQGETHVCDADWNHIGSPYLTYTDAIDYVVYYHNGYSYKSVSPSENRQVRPFESFMFQANMEQLNQKDIAFFPLSANNQNSALSVYGRAYLAINGEETVKIILNDEASENFVVNEDGWYMAPTTDVFSTMSLKVADAEASMSVQPEPNELPLTIYTGVASEQTISLSRFDGEQNVFLKDAVTGDVVCLNDEDYTFTATPKTTIANRFTVSMVEPTGICDQPTTDGDIKAVVTTDGIKLFGTVEGDEVTLYSASGMVIANAVAEDGITNIETSANGVIIIKVAEETVKVVK